MYCLKERPQSVITVCQHPLAKAYLSGLIVGLQLAEVSSIPRSVVDDAKRIAELVQQQIQVRTNSIMTLCLEGYCAFGD